MEDDKRPDAPTATPDEEAKPKMVEVEEEELEFLKAASSKYIALTESSQVLTVAQLERRTSYMDPGVYWGPGQQPGLFLLPNRCGHYKGLEAIYFRGTLGLRCRVCKRLAHRIKVAEGPPEPPFPGPAPETSTATGEPAPAKEP